VLQPAHTSSSAAVAAAKTAVKQKRSTRIASLIDKFDCATDHLQRPPCSGIDATKQLFNAVLTDPVTVAFTIAIACVAFVVAVKLAITLW
jgi:hypothetical protein